MYAMNGMQALACHGGHVGANFMKSLVSYFYMDSRGRTQV